MFRRGHYFNALPLIFVMSMVYDVFADVVMLINLFSIRCAVSFHIRSLQPTLDVIGVLTERIREP